MSNMEDPIALIDQALRSVRDIMSITAEVKQEAIKQGFSKEEAFALALETWKNMTVASE